MSVSEKLQLLGKGCYKDIPDVITLKAIPTTSELDYTAAEDFDGVMLDKILPNSIEENINPRNLLEIDYQWVLRALRIINYGPYHGVNQIYCPDCAKVHQGDYQVDFRNIDCVPLPDNFKNDIIIKKSEFIDFDKDIHIHLLTINEALHADKDKLFSDKSGKRNNQLARTVYSIHQIGNDKVTQLEARSVINTMMSPADYKILTEIMQEKTNFGLRLSGHAVCPVCHSKEALFIAPVNDRFFRVTLDDLRLWKADKNRERVSGSASTTKKAVSKNL